MTQRLLVLPFVAGLVIAGTTVVALAQQSLGELPGELGRSLREAVVEAAYGVVQDGQVCSAPNPAQGMRSTFTAEEGVRIEGGDGEGTWGLRFELEAWGRSGALVPVQAVEPVAKGRRVEYRRGSLTEWYVNETRGLEQGFSIETAPGGEGSLRLVLAIGGELSAEILRSGRDALLMKPGGRPVARYAGLRAWDSTGRQLPASLAAAPGCLVIQVEDEQAVYPLEIDPLIAIQEAKFEGIGLEFFGTSVAVSGDSAAVSALGFSTEGGVKMFQRTQGQWYEQQVLTASDGTPGDEFGTSVALDGDVLVVGAPGDDHAAGVNAGSAYVFVRNAAGWVEQQRLTASDAFLHDSFGLSVAISGETILTGAWNEGGGWLLDSVKGLAWDPESNKLYGTEDNNGLAEILPAGGGGALVSLYGNADAEGLEFVPSTNTLYGADDAFDRLVIINPATGNSVPVGPFGFTEVKGLAFDPSLGVLYGVDTQVDKLITIDPLTGAGTAVGLLGFSNVAGLAFDPIAGVLYGSDTVTDRLIRIKTATGSGTAIGPMGFDGVRGLAFDPAMRTLYGTDEETDQMLTIDTSTGGATSVGPLERPGAAYVFVLEGANWVEQARLSASDGAQLDLFGTSVGISGDRAAIGASGDSYYAMVHAGSAYVFERTGSAWNATYKLKPSDATQMDQFGSAVAITDDMILVGAPYNDHFGFQDAGAAYVFVPSETTWTEEARLISNSPSPLSLLGYAVATSPGSDDMALIGSLRDDAAYLFVRESTGWTLETELSASDGPALGNAVALSGVTAVVADLGDSVAYAFRIATPAAETYCTAGTSASGCQASISAVGIASASAPSGFSLLADRVEGAKGGMFFFGTSGPQAVPWGHGTSFQCVAPPVTRAGPLAGVGTPGECDGTFAQDLNALWCPTCSEPQKNAGVGAEVQAQLWYRDPLNTSNQPTSLSDAIEFVVGL